MAMFVLVPGHWLGGWAWEEVAAHLAAAGHGAHAVTLTGMAERAGEASPDVDADTHIADVVAAIEDAVSAGGVDRVVLVGHSGANMAVTGAADRVPGRVARVVYVDSGPMPSGMAAIEFRSPEERAELLEQVERDGGGWLIPVPPFDPAADPEMLAGIPGRRLAEMRERGTPQPVGTVTQPVKRPDPAPDVPRALVCSTIPLAAVLEMAEASHPVFKGMAGPDWTYRELPTGHWPMFSRPADLAAILAGLAG
ncbi:alpha/beta fold hydrolase [Spirillospora albida]|uniref:alpha/beta fold hydrolase n=1 Tax=Spirillospora albida TaxID=58123 RepID=UPI0004C1A9B0|nr:alpha/beta hydrolase [Spirillospora albida]